MKSNARNLSLGKGTCDLIGKREEFGRGELVGVATRVDKRG